MQVYYINLMTELTWLQLNQYSKIVAHQYLVI